jgi:membrane-associated phospholipid phosphatase
MPFGFSVSHVVWMAITQLGSAALVLPLAAMTSLGLLRAQQREALTRWMLALALTASITLVSKILFMGWGLGVATLDFTGVSGHALLASGVLPMCLCAVFAKQPGRGRAFWMGVGLVVAAVVAVSRVALGAHSISEVVLAWVLGAWVSRFGVQALDRWQRRPLVLLIVPCLLALGVVQSPGRLLPTHQWETQLALLLSGRERPYTRAELHQRLLNVKALPDAFESALSRG